MKRKEILNKATEMVCGHREQDYGTPEDNFGIIAKLWSVYSGHIFNTVDVAMMMALLKIARIKSGTMTDDSFIDLAGYAACGGEIAANYADINKLIVHVGKMNNEAKNMSDFMKSFFPDHKGGDEKC